MMNFLDLIGKGIEKANHSKAAIREVAQTFEDLNTQLRKFQPYPLNLSKATSTLQSIARTMGKLQSVEHEYLPEDQLILSAEIRENTYASEIVAGWRQHIDGYPCTLKFSGQEISCFNKKELLSAISELLSSIAFGNAVNNLIERYKPTKPSSPNAPLEMENKISNPKKVPKRRIVKDPDDQGPSI